MSGIKKIQKDDIIKASIEIIRENGLENLNARAIAKKLNCSTQPIFYQYNNMDEIKGCAKESIKDYFKCCLSIDSDAKYPYKSIGKNYINFAKDEPNLFKILFMEEENISPEEFLMLDKSYPNVQKTINKQLGFEKEQASKFHLRMWMFTHGIACLIATKTCSFTDEEISNLLTDEFTALMLLEKKNESN